MRTNKEKPMPVTELDVFLGLWRELKGFFDNPDEKFRSPGDSLALLDLKIKILESYFPFNSLFSDEESAAFRMLEYCRTAHLHTGGLGVCMRLSEGCGEVCGLLEGYREFLNKK